MRRIRWTADARPLPEHPYRDSALINVVLGTLIVIISTATGGAALPAVGIGAGFFVVATAWTWWRWRERIAKSEGGR